MANIKLNKLVKVNESNGNYSVYIASAQRAFELSRDIPLEALQKVEGKTLLAYHISGRFVLSERNFTNETDRALFSAGSFNAVACTDNGCAHHIYGNVWLCTNCGAIVYSETHKCGERLCYNCNSVLKTTAEKEAGFCLECAKKKAGRVNGYHCRPNRERPLFERPHLRDSYAHLGAEIEIDHREGFDGLEVLALSNIINPNPYKPFIEFERDGSIGGVECITAPTTLKGFNNLSNDLATFYERAKSYGGVFAKRNGLHFHIDRTYFGADESEEQAKAVLMICFLVNHYYDFFKSISGRENDQFYYARGKEGCKGIASTARACSYSEHTDAVNLSGAHTIELRFFGGHIDDSEKFLACADIVNAIARWAKASSIAQAEKATPANIVRYINNTDRVKAFIEHQTPRGFRTEATDALKEEFLTALAKKTSANE